MKIRTVIASTSLVAAGATGAAALVVSNSATAVSGGASTFTVRVGHGSQANIDLGKPGFSAGDESPFVAPLTRNGHHVGHAVGNCTTARVARTADQLCEFVLVLGSKGQITAEGAVRAGQSGPGTFQLPIVGGTGHYQGAAGHLSVTAGSGPSFPIKVSLR